MGAQQSLTSTEISSETSPTAGEKPVLPFLELATKTLQQSQELTSEDAPVPLQFNHGQCRYLVKKLETAVQSATDSMSLSSPRKSTVVDMKDWKFIGKWKFLVRLAMDVHSFIQECGKEIYWIQAASMLINAFEHVASLESHLELCIWSFRNTGRIILGTALRRELISISDARNSRSGVLVDLMKKVGDALNLESLSHLQGRQLAVSLLGELEVALANNPVIPGQPEYLAVLSVRDQVNLLGKVVALPSESISNPEEQQLATSLAERFLVSVIDPVSDEADHIDFMRVDCKVLEREEILGKGSFGEVYRVKWLGIPAAMKAFPDQENGGSPQANFVKEVSILARQSHPNIVQLLCYVKEARTEGIKYSMVQELMDKDLKELIDHRLELDKAHEIPQKSPFSIDEVVDTMLQIAEGMDYLYRRKVLHRDLKSQNILVKVEKLEEIDFEYVHAKVADFGISKTKERTITRSHPTWNIGTTRWMAPELIKIRDKTGDWYPEWNPSKCDVYSFGMVSYEILTGNEPFGDDTPSAMKQKVMQDERPPLSLEYPCCLRSLIKKCWRGEPMERPSFAEICKELRFMKGSLLIGWDL